MSDRISSADLRAELLGRDLTEVERAADDHTDQMRERNAARYAIWLDQQSAKERRRMGHAAIKGDECWAR